MRFAILLAAGIALGGCARQDGGESNVVGANAEQPIAVRAGAPDKSSVVQPGPRPNPAVSACLVQDGELLRMTPLKAVGTEPFWAARIEGRCVTYSHPEDPQGKRVWTRFTLGPDGGIWVGALGGSRFELRTRSAADCSDGMSDNRYPLAVTVTVDGEQRRGCAGPI